MAVSRERWIPELPAELEDPAPIEYEGANEDDFDWSLFEAALAEQRLEHGVEQHES